MGHTIYTETEKLELVQVQHCDSMETAQQRLDDFGRDRKVTSRCFRGLEET
jgi:hypothetical protein